MAEDALLRVELFFLDAMLGHTGSLDKSIHTESGEGCFSDEKAWKGTEIYGFLPF